MKVALVYRDAMGRGGYPLDVRCLAESLVRHGHEVVIYCHERYGNRRDSALGCYDGHNRSYRVHPLGDMCDMDFDIIHFIGILDPVQNRRLAEVTRHSRTVVVSPLTQLMPFHLKRRAWKKYPYLHLIRPMLRRVRLFHVFDDRERGSVETWLGREIDIFTAGLGLPEKSKVSARQVVARPRQSTGEPMTLLYFGRNDVYQKGLDILIDGFARVAQTLKGCRLIIAGRPWKGSTKRLEKAIKLSGAGGSIRVVGPVSENRKYELLANASYLIYLSRWDGPPRPIRAALDIGTPVIISPETNMASMVNGCNAGIVVELNAEQVAQGIQMVVENGEMRAKHSRGAKMARNQLEWDRVAEAYIAGYRVLG